MGRSGIGVTRFFDLTAEDEFITTDRVRIEDNRIERCLQLAAPAVPAGMTDAAAQGAIVLADAEALYIAGNDIVANGRSHVDPICGVFVLRSNGVTITNNRIVDNAPRVATTATVRAGWRGGVVLPSARPPLVTLDTGELSILRQNGEPAARIHDNVIVVPEGRPLAIVAQGMVSIQGNELTSRGPGLANASTNDVTSLSSLMDRLGGALAFIANLGLSNEAGLQLLAFKSTQNLVVDPDGQRRAAADPRPRLDPLPAIAAGGTTSFNDNRCFLDLLEKRSDIVLSAVILFTLDDLSVQDNQIVCDLGQGDLLVFNLLAFAWSVRVIGNRLQESAFLQAVSAFTFALTMNTTAHNQSTHCLMVLALLAAWKVDVANLVLATGGHNSDNCRVAASASDAVLKNIDSTP
jgi:hypothetical protein